MTTVPLTLLTLHSLTIAWPAHDGRHAWWLAAAVVIFFERIMTFSYFIPTALKLMRADTLAEPIVSGMASQWMILNHVRSAFCLLGWLAALRGLSLSTSSVQ